MTYQDCLDFLFSQLPIYQREGKAAYKADLTNTLDLLARLNNPERNFKSIHIAGTNGKGSVSHMMASILQESGLKTGLYTSPHLKDFRERIKINGENIPEQKVVDFVETHSRLVEDIRPSFFEWTVALAFHHFHEEKVDIAVVETGMGGRLDSTNVLIPELSIITNIGLDHTRFLGNSIASIAREKAGIIKNEIPVVIGETTVESRPVFEEVIEQKNTKVIYSGENSRILVASDLKGPYQEKNIRTVLDAIEVLRDRKFEISKEHVIRGLSRVKDNTGLRGRWEFIHQSPPVLVDMAHNPDGVQMIMKELLAMKYNHLHIVWGMVNDKDYASILSLLPKDATYYFCRPDIPRGLGEHLLKGEARMLGLEGDSYSSVSEALERAKRMSKKNDLIFVGGSTFVVAEAIP